MKAKTKDEHCKEVMRHIRRRIDSMDMCLKALREHHDNVLAEMDTIENLLNGWLPEPDTVIPDKE